MSKAKEEYDKINFLQDSVDSIIEIENNYIKELKKENEEMKRKLLLIKNIIDNDD